VTDLILRMISIRIVALFAGDPPYSSLRMLDYMNHYKLVSKFYGEVVY
jgi:hypothetical protein